MSWAGASQVVGLLVVICCATEYAYHGLGFVWFVAVGSLICALVFLVLYILNIPSTVSSFLHP